MLTLASQCDSSQISYFYSLRFTLGTVHKSPIRPIDRVLFGCNCCRLDTTNAPAPFLSIFAPYAFVIVRLDPYAIVTCQSTDLVDVDSTNRTAPKVWLVVSENVLTYVAVNGSCGSDTTI